MITVLFSQKFIRQLKKLEPALLEEVYEKVELFKNPTQHKFLRAHALTGPLKGRVSFSVNYRHRIVFMWQNAKKHDTAILLVFGDHSLYDR